MAGPKGTEEAYEALQLEYTDSTEQVKDLNDSLNENGKKAQVLTTIYEALATALGEFIKQLEAQKKLLKETSSEDGLQAVLDKYKSYEQQIKEVTAEYNKDTEILKAKLSGNELAGALKMADSQKEKKLEEIAKNMLGDNDMWNKIISSTGEMSRKDLKELIWQAGEMQSIMDKAAKTATGVEKAPEDKSDKEKRQDKREKKQEERSQEKADNKGYDKSWVKEFSDSLNEVKGNIPAEALAAFQKAVDGLEASLSKKGGADLFKKIGTDLTAAGEGIKGMGSMVSTIWGDDNETASKANDVMQMIGGVATGLGTAAQGTAKMMSGDVVGGLTDMIKGIGAAIKSIFDFTDKKKEREIQELQKKIDASKKAYEALSKKLEDSYSTEATSVIKDQEAELKSQKKNIEDQIRLENEKKSTDKKKIQAWQAEIKKINDELEDTQGKLVNAIFGKDVKSAIADFAKAYVDAWIAAGGVAEKQTEKMKALTKNLVKDLMKSAMVQAASAILDTPVENLMNYVTSVLMGEKSLDLAQLDTLIKGIDSVAEGMNSDLAAIYEHLGFDETDRSATAKGIATASQDTVDELNGRFTAIQLHTYLITGQLQTLTANSEIIRGYVEEIRNHTSSLSGIGLRMENLNKNIGNIYSRGIAIRES